MVIAGDWPRTPRSVGPTLHNQLRKSSTRTHELHVYLNLECLSHVVPTVATSERSALPPASAVPGTSCVHHVPSSPRTGPVTMRPSSVSVTAADAKAT